MESNSGRKENEIHGLFRLSLAHCRILSLMTLPKDFQDHMKALLQEEYPSFLASLNTSPPVSIRHHPVKAKKKERSEPVPWYPQGEYLPERPSFTLDPLFHAGTYYVQEASSMFVAYALRQLIDPKERVLALDLTAAPGGKSTLLTENLSLGSLLIANELIRSRYPVLLYNHYKWGYPNVLCTNHDPADFAPLAGQFDLVLVDAPCSGEGLFRKDPAAIEEWSLKAVEHCHLRQKRILREAIPLVKDGGLLFYSTCTYNEWENRESLNGIRESGEWEEVRFEIPADWGILEREWGYAFLPHHLRGEGFFFSAFRRKSGALTAMTTRKNSLPWPSFSQRRVPIFKDWIQEADRFAFFDSGNGISALPIANLDQTAPILRHLKRARPVLEIGDFKKDQFIPSPILGLSLSLGQVESLSLEKEEALQFLKGETLAPRKDKKSWQLMTYQDHPLGWGKALPQRINNYYPKEWRIKRPIDRL